MDNLQIDRLSKYGGITKEENDEFAKHLKWFYSSSLFTKEEKDGMEERINKYVMKNIEKYTIK